MFESGTEKAVAGLRKLCEARTELEAKATAAAAELAKLRADSGERELAEILEGADAGPGRARAVELDLRLSGLAAARAALLQRIAGAQQALQKAKAEAIRAEAGKLQAALEKHVAESNRLRKALEDHDGAPYVLQAEALRALHAASPGIPIPAGDSPVWPASMRMQQEIHGLLVNAAATEVRKMEARGQVSGADLAELLAAVGDNPLAPAEAELRQSFADMEALAVAAWERHRLGDFSLGRGPAPDERVTSYSISWVDGRVDRQHSTWQNSRRPERFDPSKPKAAPVKAAGSFPDGPAEADFARAG
jgi:hypothetical protein